MAVCEIFDSLPGQRSHIEEAAQITHGVRTFRIGSFIYLFQTLSRKPCLLQKQDPAPTPETCFMNPNYLPS